MTVARAQDSLPGNGPYESLGPYERPTDPTPGNRLGFPWGPASRAVAHAKVRYVRLVGCLGDPTLAASAVGERPKAYVTA